MAKKVGRGILYAALFCILLRACGAIVLGGHDWQGATCTEPRTCATCNAQRGKPLGHDWQEATCTAPRTCARCGETEGSCIDHDWANATCIEAEHCSMCGERRYRNSLPLGHEWREATCTEPKICTRCGKIEGDALGHTWMKATCLAPKTCSTCGETEGSIAKEHTWVAATCMSPKTCSVCGKTEGKKTKEHTWVDATCTEEEHCSVCGKDRHWYSLPLGHDWQDATCTAPKTCTRCGETEGELQHYFVSYHWETTIEPTCQNEGEAAHNCLLCGAVETKTLPIIDHEAGDWATIQKATPTAPGIRVKLCTMCGAEMEREEYPYRPASTGTAATTDGGGGGNNFNTYDNEEQQNTAAKYVLNTSTRVFHRPTCRDVPKISPENYSVTNRTREDLTSCGWHRCGHCSP